MHHRLLTTAAALTAAAALLLSAAPASAASPQQFTGYIETGGGVSSTFLGNVSKTVTNYGVDGVNLAADGRSVTAPPPAVRQVVTSAKSRHTSRELLVSNFDDDLGDFSPTVATKMLHSASNRLATAKVLASTAKRYGFTGVQIDLESMSRDDVAGLTAFSKTLREQMQHTVGRTAKVTIAVQAATSTNGYLSYGYDIRRLNSFVDRFTLMAYDQHGPWSGAGTIGDLRWTKTVTKALSAAGAPAKKVDLGVAGYGYYWTRGGDSAQVTPKRAKQLAGSAARWSPATGEWSATTKDHTVIRWSDQKSLTVRAALARQLHLHGVAVWSLNLAPDLHL